MKLIKKWLSKLVESPRAVSFLKCFHKILNSFKIAKPDFRKKVTTNRFARSETVLDVALEDDSVGLGEPEGLVHADQGVALGGEPGEDGGVDGAAFVVNDRER